MLKLELHLIRIAEQYLIANHDQNGGGIALHSNSYIMLSNGTQLEFLNNNAVLHGGAIFLGKHW